MASTDFDAIFAALQQAKVRYLVAGGVAVVLHGHPRSRIVAAGSGQ